MTEPTIIDPVVQRDVWDCGVSCLQMLLGRPYENIRSCIREKRPTGLSVRQMRSIAKKLGHTLTYSKTYQDDDIGIWDLQRQMLDSKEQEGHFVVYVKDTIYNPAQGQWWTDADAYLKESRYWVEGILRRKE